MNLNIIELRSATELFDQIIRHPPLLAIDYNTVNNLTDVSVVPAPSIRSVQ
jgi:hypothetical protein